MAPDSALGVMGPVTAATRARADHLVTWAQAHAGINVTHVWGYDPNAGNWEHHTGRAIDLMVFGNRRAGDRISRYVVDQARPLGVQWVIWYQRIYNVSKGSWRAMADRGSPTENHQDHLHIFFDTSSFTAPHGGSAMVAGPARRRGRYLTVDGIFDAGTCKVLQAFLRVEVDGIYGPETIRAKQTWLGVEADGIDGPVTHRAMNLRVSRPEQGESWTRESTRGLEQYLNRSIAAGKLVL